MRRLLWLLVSSLVIVPAAAGEPRISPSSGPPRSENGTVELSVPGESWAVALDLPGFYLDPIETRSDGRGVRIIGKNSDTGVLASVYIEPRSSGTTAVAYRESLWRRLQSDDAAEERDEKRSMRGAAAVLDYSIPVIDGLPINQRNVNAVLTTVGMLIDVHLSKVRYAATDDASFERILASLKIVSKPETIASRR
jgi:hypothetical protein